MNNLELEKIILNKIREINNKFQLIAFEKLNEFNGKLKVPRCLIRTISNQVIHRYTSSRNENDKYGVFRQKNINKHILSLSFTLSSKESYQDVSIIRDFFSNIEGIYWWIKLNNLPFFIEEVGEIKDISNELASGILERYVFDLVIRSYTDLETDIEIIKKVDFDLKGGKN